MQNNTLIKQNIQKLVLHNRKTIINEVVQTGILREAFNSNKLPKDLTEEQFLFMLSECLSEDGNFILENYKILTHPNPTPEMLNEWKINWGKVTKAIPGILDDAWKIVKGAFKWVWKKVGDTWKWISSHPDRTPDGPMPTMPGHTPQTPLVPRIPKETGPYNFGDDGLNPFDPEYYEPGDVIPNIDIFHNPGDFGLPLDPYIVPESMSNFNHKMKHLMESNQQIDQTLLHSMLNQVNESKYLLELAIQRNQVNRIIDRI
jgi:hypothetical protein